MSDNSESKQRRDFLFESMDKYCKGTDAKLAELRKKYSDNPAVIERLRNYEDEIEP